MARVLSKTVSVQIVTAKTYLLTYRYNAYNSDIKRQVVEMAINGSGILDTSCVLLSVSTLKKVQPQCAPLTITTAK